MGASPILNGPVRIPFDDPRCLNLFRKAGDLAALLKTLDLPADVPNRIEYANALELVPVNEGRAVKSKPAALA